MDPRNKNMETTQIVEDAKSEETIYNELAPYNKAGAERTD